MEPRTALTVALVTAALAVGLVSLDLAYSLTARVETQEDGGWVTVTRSDDDRYEPFRPFDCARPEMRLVVDNDVLIGQDVEIELSYWNYSAQREERVLRDTWSMERGEVRTYTFTIPEAAFEAPNGSSGREDGTKLITQTEVQVTARVGDDIWLSACVTQEGSS